MEDMKKIFLQLKEDGSELTLFLYNDKTLNGYRVQEVYDAYLIIFQDIKGFQNSLYLFYKDIQMIGCKKKI